MGTRFSTGLSGETSTGGGVTAGAEARHGSAPSQERRLPAPAALLDRAMGELAQCLEALRMAEEVLRVQNEALREQSHRLEAERRRYKELFASVSDSLLVTDTGGLILASNRSCARLLGSREYLRPRTSVLRFLSQSDRLGMLGVLRGAKGWESGLWLSPRDDEDLWAVVTITPACTIGEEAPSLRWLIRPAYPPQD